MTRNVRDCLSFCMRNLVTRRSSSWDFLTGIPFLFRGYGKPLEEVRGIMYKTGKYKIGPYITLIQMPVESFPL